MTTQIPEWLDHVGVGWRPLLEGLHQDIVALDPRYNVRQVKQKFGALRAYLEYRDPAISALVEAATVKSAHTCEDCGKPGFIRARLDRGLWMECLCDVCVRQPLPDPW